MGSVLEGSVEEKADEGDESMKPWWVYMVRCRFDRLYTGISTDVERRVAEHEAGGPRGARNLRGKGPLRLVFLQAVGDRRRAARAEWRIKRLGRRDKERLVAGALRLDQLLDEVD